MARSFSKAEWTQINAFLDMAENANSYGIPKKRDGSIVFASWNIRKFGSLNNSDTNLPNKTEGAMNMIVRFCRQCDLIAIQEVQENTESVYFC